MFDIDQIWSSDIAAEGNGAISLVNGTTKGEQRVLRRMMTNPGDYLWHPDYGAGIPRYVGATLRVQELEAVIRAQLAREAVVAQTPIPSVVIKPILNGVFVSLAWVDANTQERATVEFDVTA